MNLDEAGGVIQGMNVNIVVCCSALAAAALALECAGADSVATNAVADLGTVVVEGSALSKYRPETVNSGTFTDVPPEKLPCVVDTLTEDFIREHDPTDLNDLLRHVPGIETGGTSLLVRQPGLFTVRGKGGSEPAIDGLYSVGRGPGLFMDPFLMERVEVVKGPIASHAGGSGAGCSAAVLAARFLPALAEGSLRNILFLATGALLSPASVQQGESIPAIAHLAWLSHEAGGEA